MDAVVGLGAWQVGSLESPDITTSKVTFCIFVCSFAMHPSQYLSIFALKFLYNYTGSVAAPTKVVPSPLLEPYGFYSHPRAYRPSRTPPRPSPGLVRRRRSNFVTDSDDYDVPSAPGTVAAVCASDG